MIKQLTRLKIWVDGLEILTQKINLNIEKVIDNYVPEQHTDVNENCLVDIDS